MLMLVGVILGLLWFCLIDLCWEVSLCKTQENSNFLKNGKMVILVKIRKFSRSRITKRTSPLESSREI